MKDKQRIKISKAMSLLLRHRPQLGNLTLDDQGWVDMNALISGLARLKIRTDAGEVLEVIATSDKQRFAWDEAGKRVRANQGHSVRVDLDLPEREPPDILFHGTVDRFIPAIRRKGLQKGNRHHVHLSGDRQTAQKVGERRGKSVILKVDAGRMVSDGHTFYLSKNGVWLTNGVPAAYLTLPKE